MPVQQDPPLRPAHRPLEDVLDPHAGVPRRIDSSQGKALWLLDPKNSTLTSLDPATGKAGSPLGLNGNPIEAVVAFGSLWVAAGHVVDRVDLSTSERSTIPMPRGVWAGSIAADTSSGAIWVGNSGSAPPNN